MKFGLRKRENPGTDLDIFRRRINGMFNDFFTLEPVGFMESDWMPAVDIEEDVNNIFVKADLPGIDEKNINVRLEKNVLSISGERREEKKTEGKDKRSVVTERSFGSFTRAISLPDSIKSDQIRAEFKNGILSITIPRTKAEESKKIKISIN